MSSIVELRDGRPVDDRAEVAAPAPSERAYGSNWGLIVALLACLAFWASVAAGIYLVLA